MNVDRFIPIVRANLTLLDQGYSVNEVARVLMLSYGDVDTKPSGLVSKSLVHFHEPTSRYYRKGKYTEEHFKTRTKTCREVCENYLNGTLTDGLLHALLDEGREVHFVTKEENERVRRYQQDHAITSWEEEYDACGIELVEDPGMFGNSKYYYIIDDVAYRSVNHAADELDVHSRTIKNRSNSDKFPNYLELEYEHE